jgi:hypothetical protein
MIRLEILHLMLFYWCKLFTQRYFFYHVADEFWFFVVDYCAVDLLLFLFFLLFYLLHFSLKFYHFLLFNIQRVITSVREHRLLEILHSEESFIVLFNQKVIDDFVSYVYPLHLGDL